MIIVSSSTPLLRSASISRPVFQSRFVTDA
jgi:hypothetical protein